MSKEEHVSFQNSTAAAALVWDVSGPVLLWCSSAVGCPTEAFLQKSPFCFTAWDFSTAELFMKLNYFSYLSWGNTLRGFLKVNPAFITSCSLLDNLGIILLLISPVEMKLLWIGMGLVEADSNCRFFFLLLEKRQVSNRPKFPLNRSPAAAECQLEIELPRENTRNTNTLCCALWDGFL